MVETVSKGEVSEAGREERDRLVEVLAKGETGECRWKEGKLVEITVEDEHLERGQGREWVPEFFSSIEVSERGH